MSDHIQRQIIEEHRFPCEQCGALLNYAVGSNTLACHYCGHATRITADETVNIQECDFHEALLALSKAPRVSPEVSTQSHCGECGASFTLNHHEHAGSCPFCGTSVVVSTEHLKPLTPQALLPFAIDQEAAKTAYRNWLKKLWFAPNKLKYFAKHDINLNGVYLPYWTYDSQTQTVFDGARGDIYFVTEYVTVNVNGRRQRQRRQVAKVRWTSVSGRTKRHFDDVLVGATRTLPRKLVDWLQPWDLSALEAYRSEYLSGFSSEVYQVELDQGFDVAKQKMDATIRTDVRRQIGGDQQKIHRMRTQHNDTTFKYILLPVWTAAFSFRGKTYRFVVNGRTGKTRGEHPLSYWKIGFASVLFLTVVAVFLWAADQSGVLDLFLQSIMGNNGY